MTQAKLTVLLMSLHVEALPSPLPRHSAQRAVMRYIVEETPADTDTQTTDADTKVSTELC